MKLHQYLQSISACRFGRNFYCTSVKNYLLNLLGNLEIADIITPNKFVIGACLSITGPIKIDYNFIEISDGFCFDMEGKKFIRNPKQLKGSPRAYVCYTHDEDKIPNPKLFIEGMDNIIFVVVNKNNYLMLSFKCSTYS